MTSRPALRRLVPVSTTSAMIWGDAQLDRGLDGAVEVHDGGVDALLGEVLGDDALVGGGDRHPLEVLGAVRGARAGGVTEGGPAEVQRQDLLGVGAGVQEQVAAGDADVEPAGRHVDRDVLRAEVEELHLVVRVDDDEFLGLLALPVARLMEHCHRRSGERTLVGDGDAQHGTGFLCLRCKGVFRCSSAQRWE
ncbi:hypothetical protein GCM10019017_66370 [Streptomyces showdoensis]